MHGFSQDIIEWHKANPSIPIDCFYDKPNAPEGEKYSPNLTFHRLHGEKFLKLMSDCRAVVCTAGFESVSEAAYLGKPLLMVPVENHLEQFLNAWDAQNTGLGIRDSKFDLSRILAFKNTNELAEFRNWVDQAESIVIRAVHQAVERESPAMAETDNNAIADAKA